MTILQFNVLIFFLLTKPSVVESPADFHMKHISKCGAISISEFKTSYACD